MPDSGMRAKHVMAKEDGVITRQRRPRGKPATKVCPYCWETHETTARGSVFCTPEHGNRWYAHNRAVVTGRDRAIARLLHA